MSNFKKEFEKGQSGMNQGLYMGEGLDLLSKALGGIQSGRLYTFASSPKVGKTTLIDYAFILSPYLECLKKNTLDNVLWVYYSLEIDRISKEFDFATFFLYNDYNIRYIKLENCTKNGKDIIELSPDYLRGRIIDDDGNIIKVKDSIKEKMFEVYEKHIKVLFGEYDDEGICRKLGKILFEEHNDNPTGICKRLTGLASRLGTIKYDSVNTSRIISYTPNNPNLHVIVVTDHIRKLIIERNFTMKQNVDKMSEYHVNLAKSFNFTFVNIVHINRDMMNTDNLKYSGDLLYPKAEFIKDSGNLSEDSSYVFTMMSPNDDRYNLKEHFGVKIKDNFGNPLYPDYRSIHLVESRFTYYPQHFKVNMLGNLKTFEKLEFNK